LKETFLKIENIIFSRKKIVKNEALYNCDVVVTCDEFNFQDFSQIFYLSYEEQLRKFTLFLKILNECFLNLK